MKASLSLKYDQCAVFLRSRAESEHAANCPVGKVEKQDTGMIELQASRCCRSWCLIEWKHAGEHLASEYSTWSPGEQTGLRSLSSRETEFAELRQLRYGSSLQRIDKR